MSRPSRTFAPILLAAALFVTGRSAAGPTDDDCLACHDDPALAREDGRALKLDRTALAASVHGEAGLSCVDCHADLSSATEFPHEARLAPAACEACHDQPGAERARSVHAKPGKDGRPAATCEDCHGAHDVRRGKDPASRTNHFNVAATCLGCHSDARRFAGRPGENGLAPANFEDSIHGRALEKAGLSVAPNCADCHHPHDVRRASDPESPVHRTAIPSTCGKCHEKILGHYSEGVHGTAMAKGNPKAPVCADCHSAHEIRQVDAAAWKVSVVRECGTCHEASLSTYRDTYHGQVTALGYARVATCADCHDSHRIFPEKDPRSAVSAERRLETCRKCHPSATAGFAQYDPHADPKNRRRNPVLSFTSQFMKLLLGFVFAFFGVHTLLWLPRSAVERRRMAARRRGAPPSAPGPEAPRKEEGR
ncbi:hypothetical protein FBQ97_13435 [Acidobacteria bacterium ACD]|nr:hypothetical protein [Acidobacteria bacterium ACD]